MSHFSKILFLCMFPVVLMAQERAMVWYFGNNTGLDFSSGEPEVLFNPVFKAEAGCSSISDRFGNILFYTNGNQVYNRKNQLMLNGDSLNGTHLVNQNSVIIPYPENDSLYYLFTLSDIDTIRGFNYSLINMKGENGDGEIIEKNKLITYNLMEKIAAVKHCNNKDYWIITHGYTNNFYVYKVDENGFNYDTIKSKTGLVPKADIGYLKVSPAGNKIVLPINNDSILAQVFSFNNKTGKVNNPINIYKKVENTYCYGLEFSPNGNYLYLNTGGKKYKLFQYSLINQMETEINASATLIAEGNNYAMQLAPDGKIYIAKENKSQLSRINFPNKQGKACEFVEIALHFKNGNSLMGLPNFVSTWFYKPDFDYQNHCLNDSTIFSFSQYQNYDSVFWNFGNNSLKDEPGIINNTYHIFPDTGDYNVSLSAWHCGINEEVNKTITIYPYPVLNLPPDSGICNNCTLVLDAGDFDNYLWSTGDTSRFLNIYNQGWYAINVSNNNCFASDSIYVYEYQPLIIMPNTFTPNGDGLNDEFKILNPDYVENFHMWVHDRRGMIVYDSHDKYSGWDGKYQGQDCYSQTYIYYIEYSFYNEKDIMIDNKIRGFVNIIR